MLRRMPRSLAGFARLAALLTLALLLAACSLSKIQAGPGPPVIAPKQALALGPAPIKGPNVKFGIITVTGIPGTFQIALDDSLKKFAATRNLKLVAFGDSTATYRVEGYISAIGDVNRVILVYVWDVFDAAGNRLHRVSGQEVAEEGAVDPWTAIELRDIDAAARATIDALADWTRV
jgi:hypothetical protein